MATTRFQLEPLVRTEAYTYRMGTKAAPLTDQDVGKAVTLVDDNRVDLAAAGDEILGFISSVEAGTRDGFTIGGVKEQDYALVDTGAVATGTPVTVVSNPAKGTAGLTVVGAAAGSAPGIFKWIVVRPGLVKRV